MLNRKKQIMDTAEELLQKRSFSSFSYQDLSDQIGISKATIHHHFPTKDDLGVGPGLSVPPITNRDSREHFSKPSHTLEPIRGVFHSRFRKSCGPAIRSA